MLRADFVNYRQRSNKWDEGWHATWAVRWIDLGKIVDPAEQNDRAIDLLERLGRHIAPEGIHYARKWRAEMGRRKAQQLQKTAVGKVLGFRSQHCTVDRQRALVRCPRRGHAHLWSHRFEAQHLKPRKKSQGALLHALPSSARCLRYTVYDFAAVLRIRLRGEY